MKVSQAVYYHLEYHKANSQQNTQRCVEFVLGKFYDQFQKRVLASVSLEDVLSFLTKLTFKRKQTTKRNRHSVLHSFYNFTINTSLPDLKNPCCTMVKKSDQIVRTNLRPHDPEKTRCDICFKAGTPLEIVSKVILRHADLSTTQRCLGNVSDIEAIRWIENLHGWSQRAAPKRFRPH